MWHRTLRSISIAAWIVLGGVAGPRPSAAQFTALTKNPLGVNGMGFGVAWVDVDQDGDDDLYLTYDGPNLLLRNDGEDDFTDASAAPIDNGDNSGAGVWGDSDNDGDPDLYLVNYLTSNKLFRNEGASFSDATTGPLGDLGAGQGAAWADFDRDGDLDLYLVQYGTPNKLLQNQGAGVFVDATTGPLADAGWGVAATWGDYDSDGDPDLYITNDGPNRLLRNDGAAVFTRVTGLTIEDSGAGEGAAWGDFDNDGDLDLYVANYGTASKLLRNDGNGLFTSITSGPLGDRVNAMGVAWGDYDNDGDLDLFRTSYGSGNKLLRNDGGALFTAITSGPLGDAYNSNGTAWADYDRDGDLDLYVVNDGHANALLRNDLVSANHWLQILLVGEVSNRSAIGARVCVVAGARQIREISGGSGYLSQNSLTVAFGLGASAVAESIIVSWPSGLRTIRVAVAANQRLVIDEQDAVGVDPESPNRLPVFQLAAPTPSPVRRGASLRYEIPRASWVHLAIFDVQGRCVATLVDGFRSAGCHTVDWQRRDDHGQRVPSGVHFLKLEAGGQRATFKLVTLP